MSEDRVLDLAKGTVRIWSCFAFDVFSDITESHRKTLWWPK